MNSLCVVSPSVIGSPSDIKLLENKTSGKIWVLSDSHGESELVEKIITDFGPDCDALVFCGDGMTDIIACLEEASRNESLRVAMPPVVVCAKGNGDPESFSLDLESQEDEDGNPLPVAKKLDVSLLASFRLAGRTIMVSHGHRYMVDMGTEVLHSVAENIDADLAFFGHTHRPHREEIGATLILNPGSCAQPRGGNPPTVAVVSFPGSTERYHTEFFEIKKTLFGGWDFSIFH